MTYACYCARVTAEHQLNGIIQYRHAKVRIRFISRGITGFFIFNYVYVGPINRCAYRRMGIHIMYMHIYLLSLHEHVLCYN